MLDPCNYCCSVYLSLLPRQQIIIMNVGHVIADSETERRDGHSRTKSAEIIVEKAGINPPHSTNNRLC